jgi:hypothetical protein
MIVDIILFILSCAGATQILCYGSILDKIRPKNGILGELFRCSMCVGFHVGYIQFTLFWISGVLLFSNFYIGAFVFALVSSYTSYICDKLFSDEGIMIKIVNK